MLAYLVNHNSSITAVKMEVISNTKCQIHHLHPEEGFIQKDRKIITNLYASIYVPLLKLSYLHW